LTIKRAGKALVAALIFLSSFSSSGLALQAPPAPQSTNQIVRPAATEQAKTQQVTTQTTATPQPAAAPPRPLEQANNQATSVEILIPPAPVIIKRDPNAVSIPFHGVELQTETGATESPYVERPATSSGVKIGSLYGYRRDPFTGRARFHSGLDIKARWGDPIGACLPGVVQFAGWYHGYGQLLIINHGGGVTTHYAHLSSFAVQVGDKVERGVLIGYAGSTGRATSPHLHYEVRIDGKYVNPLQPLALDPASEYFKTTRPESGQSDLLITRPRRAEN
jgi:murein DD-endopeptidase MepM/ murein hydrolase activator NlpD